AWRLIAAAGSITDLFIEGDGAYQAEWRYAELAAALGWIAPVLEVAAFTILVLVAARVLSSASLRRIVPADADADAEAIR
ncbi:MAG TPA: hypothetical protein VN035_05670, partial [Microbacterium sp.]|nr:hypothetical protein [Microbacterium sp.]